MKPEGLVMMWSPSQALESAAMVEPLREGDARGERGALGDAAVGGVVPGGGVGAVWAGLGRGCVRGEGSALGRLLVRLLCPLPGWCSWNEGKGKEALGAQPFWSGIVEAGEVGPRGTCGGNGPQLCWLEEREGGTGSGPE